MNYLAQIIVYYKALKEADKDAHTRDTSVYNSTIKVSENTLITDNNQIDTQNGCVHKKEESMVDTRIWSYCLYEQCRDIAVSKQNSDKTMVSLFTKHAIRKREFYIINLLIEDPTLKRCLS